MPPEDQTARKSQFEAMEDLLFRRIVRSIGVSNYGIHHLDQLMTHANILPSVNQVELNPLDIQRPKLHEATRSIGALTTDTSFGAGVRRFGPTVGKTGEGTKVSPRHKLP